jgi:uncharacterized protein (TIGR02246 family)
MWRCYGNCFKKKCRELDEIGGDEAMTNSKRNGLALVMLVLSTLAIIAVNAGAPARVFAVSGSGVRRAAEARPADDGGASAAVAAGQEWSKQWSAGHLDETLALYTPDAVFFTGEGGRVAGRAAIHDLFQKWIDASSATIQLHSLNSETSGDFAYDSGDYTETITFKTAMGSTPAGTKTDYVGCFLLVLKRQADGKWLIAQQMWTGAPAAAK